jgi:GNAT superfamily N-acetyltransferase
MKIQKVTSDKKEYLDLLLLADEQEDMIDRYLERGEMFILTDDLQEGDNPCYALAECVVTREGAGIYEIKNLATRPEHQKKGYARQLIQFLFTYYPDCKTMYVGTGDSPLTVPFYKRCGFTESHRLKNFITEHYDHPIYEGGQLLTDMVYLSQSPEADPALLQQLTDRVYYLPPTEETDRPLLGYIRGDHASLMIDAGNSAEHVKLFLRALEKQQLPPPDYCVLTHWHWDHTFGIPALKTLLAQEPLSHSVLVLTNAATNEKLKEVASWEWTEEAMQHRLQTGADIEFCDRCIRLEYPDLSAIQTTTADLSFGSAAADTELILDLGGVHTRLLSVRAPHGDSVLIDIPEEKILFLGDAACEDYYEHKGVYEATTLNTFLSYLQRQSASTLLSGHGAPETKEAVLAYLKEQWEQAAQLRIRPICQNDIHTLAAAFLAQGWDDREETLWHYYADQEAGTRYVYIAEKKGLPVGYVTLLPLAKDGPFAGKYPEISDFNVLISWRRQGIGSALLDAAEADASKLSDIVTLGVGLYSDYGTAQRMYPKRGYLPDGSGVWYQGRPAKVYGTVANDDDLILYFSKTL